MSQIKLYYYTDKKTAELLYNSLETAFEDEAYPIAITEIDEEKEIFELSIYLEEDDKKIVLAQVSKALSLPESSIMVEVLPDIDWVKHSLEGLKPVRAARFFVHGGHDREKLEANDIGIEIEAGLAFGTGHHGTTSGCLEMIDNIMNREHPKNILDLGTGSGVLAIGMAKLQPVKVLATDIDPVATEVAQDNVILNGVEGSVIIATAIGFDAAAIKERSPFDLIVANILAGPLIELAPIMREQLAPNGSIILSGILDTQADKVLSAYQQNGLTHQETILKGDWVTLHLK